MRKNYLKFFGFASIERKFAMIKLCKIWKLENFYLVKLLISKFISSRRTVIGHFLLLIFPPNFIDWMLMIASVISACLFVLVPWVILSCPWDKWKSYLLVDKLSKFWPVFNLTEQKRKKEGEGGGHFEEGSWCS